MRTYFLTPVYAPRETDFMVNYVITHSEHAAKGKRG